jgi:hypothetical protein
MTLHQYLEGESSTFKAALAIQLRSITPTREEFLRVCAAFLPPVLCASLGRIDDLIRQMDYYTDHFGDLQDATVCVKRYARTIGANTLERTVAFETVCERHSKWFSIGRPHREDGPAIEIASV